MSSNFSKEAKRLLNQQIWKNFIKKVYAKTIVAKQNYKRIFFAMTAYSARDYKFLWKIKLIELNKYFRYK